MSRLDQSTREQPYVLRMVISSGKRDPGFECFIQVKTPEEPPDRWTSHNVGMCHAIETMYYQKETPPRLLPLVSVVVFAGVLPGITGGLRDALVRRAVSLIEMLKPHLCPFEAQFASEVLKRAKQNSLGVRKVERSMTYSCLVSENSHTYELEYGRVKNNGVGRMILGRASMIYCEESHDVIVLQSAHVEAFHLHGLIGKTVVDDLSKSMIELDFSAESAVFALMRAGHSDPLLWISEDYRPPESEDHIVIASFVLSDFDVGAATKVLESNLDIVRLRAVLTGETDRPCIAEKRKILYVAAPQ